MGTSYTGPTNPETYSSTKDNKVYSYQYIPRNLSEIPSIHHDKAYDRANAKGTFDALFNTKVLQADIDFCRANLYVAQNGNTFIDRYRASLARNVFIKIVISKKINKTVTDLILKNNE